MSEMTKRWKVACDDGFEIISRDAKELVSMVQRHLKDTHQKELSHDDVMKMAQPHP
jgi:predicted small metal-binding protein